MTTQEEIRIRFGGDLTGISKATWTMLDGQKKAAMEYTAFWESAIAKREAAELASIEKVRLARMADATAQVEIARGSGMYGSIEAAAAGAGAVGAGKAIGEVEHEAHGFAGILRELTVIGREGLRGNFTRMVGSVTILLGLLGGWAIAIGAATAAIAAYPAYLYYKANKAAEESDKSLQEAERKAGERMRSQIEDLRGAGVITDSQADAYKGQLDQPDGVIGVSGQISKLTARFGGRQNLKGISQAMRDANEAQRQIDELNKKERTQAEIQESIANKKSDISNLNKEIWDLEHKSNLSAPELLKTYQDIAQVKKDTLSIEQDSAEIQKLKTEDAQKQHDMDERASSLSARIGENQTRIGQFGAEYPTLEDYAGRRRVARLNKMYGKGGRFDLSAGGGSFSDIAYDALLAQKQQLWDREHNNMDQARLDQARYVSDVGKLSDANALPPEMSLQKIMTSTSLMQQHLNDLINKGAKINVDVLGTE